MAQREAILEMSSGPLRPLRRGLSLNPEERRDKVMMSASKGHRCFFPQILSFLEIIHYGPDMYKLAKVSLGHHGVMSALTLSSLCEG